MQPKPLHGAAPGFRVLNANAAATTARRHAGFPFASLAGEGIRSTAVPTAASI
jgi:hypothetical protein